MRILFFDDEKIRYDIFKQRFPDGIVVYCQSLQECKDKLTDHINGYTYFDVIHFDHDIQDLKTFEWHSSAELANWFVENCPKDRIPTMVVIHSVNQTGAWNLYHIFSLITKTFMSPFRIEFNEYHIAVSAIKKERDAKIQNAKKEISNQG